jgi:putrescine transport system ATP-binding protein
MVGPASNTIFAPWENPKEKPLIQFENVTKKFGDFTAVDNFNLSIYEKEFFALLGASGGGKSTVLRMLAGFEQPTSGRIWLDGEEIENVPPNERPTNMMFQSYALFPHLTVWDNIAFGLKRTKQLLTSSEINTRVCEMLRLTQLERFAKRKPHQISGGQRQRVALARSLAREPKLLLLDEPLGALDKKLRQETQFELMDIQEKTGTTFVIVTHDQEEAMTMASRVAIMSNGQLMQTGTPTEIYEAPKSTYVANFIGDVNLLEGNAKLEENNKISIVYDDCADPIITENTNGVISNDQDVDFAVRPEKILVSTSPDRNRTNCVKGKVEDIAYLGNVSTYHVRLETGQLVSALMTNALRVEHQEFTWEDEVWLSWSDSAGVVLPKQS